MDTIAQAVRRTESKLKCESCWMCNRRLLIEVLNERLVADRCTRRVRVLCRVYLFHVYNAVCRVIPTISVNDSVERQTVRQCQPDVWIHCLLQALIRCGSKQLNRALRSTRRMIDVGL